MKNMKKVLALLIAMIMVLGMTVTAFASGDVTQSDDGEGSQTPTLEKTIKVNGLSAGDTIKYVQVIAWDYKKGEWVKKSAKSKPQNTEYLNEKALFELRGKKKIVYEIDEQIS